MGTTSRLAHETVTDALNARDLDRFADGLADDLAFQGPGGIGSDGKRACVAFYRGLFDAFPDARLEVHDVHIADDVMVQEGTLTGTHTGVARTGRSVALDYVQVLRYRDGKHVGLSLMLDRLLMLEQLGLAADGGDRS
jgi:ketosteroid isomerase-like protein